MGGEIGRVAGEVMVATARGMPKVVAAVADRVGEGWLAAILPPVTVTEKSRGWGERVRAVEGWVACVKLVAKYMERNEGEEVGVGMVRTLLAYLKESTSELVAAKLAEALVCICILLPQQNVRVQAVEMVGKYMKELCKRESLHVSNERVGIVMVVLKGLMAIPSLAYQNIQTIQASVAYISTTFAPIHTNVLQHTLHDCLANAKVSAQVRVLSLQLLSTLLCSEEEGRQMMQRVGRESAGRSSSLPPEGGEFEILTQTLFECIESDGKMLYGHEVPTQVPSQAKDAPSPREIAYTSAAVCLVELMKLKRFADTIEPTQWQDMAWVSISPVKYARGEFVHALKEVTANHNVHPRFLCYLCLFANEGDAELQEVASSALTLAIRQLRKTHDDLGVKLLRVDTQSERETLHAMASLSMPEIIVPYLLYLLSYHPNFPTSIHVTTASDKEGMKEMVRCVQMLFNSLQSSLKKEASNLPFLFKQLNILASRCHDKFDSNNIGIAFVTRLTIKLLQEQIKTSDNVQTYPGEIVLPMEIYAYTPQADMQATLMRSAGGARAQNGYDEAEGAIKQAILLAGKGKGRARGGEVLTTPQVGATDTKSPGSGKRKKSLSPVDEDTDHEGEDGWDDLGKGGAKKRRVSRPLPSKIFKTEGSSGGKTKTTAALPVEAPTRNLPRRSAKAEVTYQEVEESEGEAEEWDEEAGRAARRGRGGGVGATARHSRGGVAEKKTAAMAVVEEEGERDQSESSISAEQSGHDLFSEEGDKGKGRASLGSGKGGSGQKGKGVKSSTRDSQGTNEEDLFSDEQDRSAKKKSTGKASSSLPAPSTPIASTNKAGGVHNKRRKVLQDVSDNLFDDDEVEETKKAAGAKKGAGAAARKMSVSGGKENVVEEAKLTRSKRARA
eukprot:gene29704-35860_t